MKREEAVEFLIAYVPTAADIDLILTNYDFMSTDEAMKASLEVFEKPFFVHGTQKRNDLFLARAQKKIPKEDLPQKIQNAILTTPDTVKEKLLEILAMLKPEETNESGKISSEIVETVEEQEVAEEDSNSYSNLEEELEGENYKDLLSEDTLPKEEPATGASDEVSKETVSEPLLGVSEQEEFKSLNCGVPVFHVKKINPDVFGLKESLLEELPQSELAKIFPLIKKKVESFELY